MVDGWYYVFQLINFPISAIIFGICIRAFWREVEENGWVVSPRFVWFGCLIMSSFLFCVLQLDPSASLGIFQHRWRAFIGFFDSSLLINAIYATFYMYMIVLSKRHLQEIPALHTYVWIVVNILSTLFVGITCLVGAITDNHFWFAVGLLGLITQELFLLVAINVMLTRVGRLFNELESTTSSRFQMQRQKLLILRIAFNALMLGAILGSLLAKNAGLNALWLPERMPVVGYDTEVFDVFYLLPDMLILFTHVAVLYAMRRPASSAKDTQMVEHISIQSNTTSAKRATQDTSVVVVTVSRSDVPPV